ncbi:MAG TPA: septum formation initiator family protein [Terriglobales bacterium]|nr:septum formation initiator family protein [Terriglobales bacterium]
MDLRLRPPSRTRIVPPASERLRAVIEEQGPKAEELAAQYVERTRPFWTWIAAEWRRLGTLAALAVTVGLVLHAMFGANGIVVYQQKRAEHSDLEKEVLRLQKENDQYVDRIKALKTDHRAIEKEAREQLHYARPGEFVYVAPDPPQRPPTDRAKN